MNAPAVTAAQGENLQVKLVTLTSRGFEAGELPTSNGRFILDIENISGFPKASISLASNRNRVIFCIRCPLALPAKAFALA
jgi:hypothetical protein